MNVLKLATIVLILGGCAAIEKPQNSYETLAYLSASWKSANVTLADLCGRAVLPTQTCESAEAQSRSVGVAVETAQTALSVGDISQANSQIKAAQMALTALQGYVRGQEASYK